MSLAKIVSPFINFTLLVFKFWQNNFHTKLPKYQITGVAPLLNVKSRRKNFTSEFMLPDRKKIYWCPGWKKQI